MNSLPEDPLSSLPDELLHHIFSFIDSIHVIEVASLSRRWRSLHSSVPTLSFNYTRFCYRFREKRFRFSDLIGWCSEAIRDRRFPVVELDFDAVNSPVRPEDIEALVSVAAELGVRRLSLAGDLFKSCLPDSVYTTRSLKELTLRSRYIKLSNTQGFPSLTTLCLETPNLSAANLISDVTSRCPNLETLVLINGNINDKTKTLNIMAPKLKRLVISYPFELWYINKDSEFVINAPLLAHVSYRGVEAIRFKMTSLRPLDEVDIDVFEGKNELYNGGLMEDEKIEKVNGVVRMIDAFKLARTIHLSEATIKCLREAAGLVEMENICDGRLRDILQLPY